jgi:hypothetical protein
MIAMCEWHTRVGGEREGGCDTGHNLCRNVVLGQVLKFFCRSREYGGIATFETHNSFAGLIMSKHFLMDFGLFPNPALTMFADIDANGGT